MYHKKSVEQKLSVCIVTYPLGNASGSYYNLIINLLKILSPLVHKIFLITANFPEKEIENPKVHIINLKYKNNKFFFVKIISYLAMQIQISYNLAKVNKKINGCVFLLSSDCLLLPVIMARMLGSEAVLTAVAPASIRARYEGLNVHSIVAPILELLMLKLSSKIMVESPHVATFMELSKYQNKIWSEGCLFILDDAFKPTNKISERKNIVGYIGRLSEEKGVLNFVKTIPEIIKERDDLEFLIGGDGQLRNEIEAYLDENNLNSKVKLVGWIPHDKLPDYMNELKLLVLPSYTEGLPNIMLEAMACETSVLATPVGGVPDLIEDEETGFILENNSPECIAKNVIRALNHADLDRIVKNARELIEKDFTYEAAVERYRKILEGF
jgi:glycosyltransferase involved in cell wall biosynthesis